MSKRERTKQRLLEAALDLFEKYGFDETTVAQIAAAAGVTPMTFFRNFPTKEHVVVDDPYDPVIADAIAAQSPRLPPLVRAARGIRAGWSQLPEPDSELVRRRVRVAAATQSLRAAVTAHNAGTEALIADALARDGVPTLVARAAAAAVLAALTAALFEWSTQTELTLSQAVHTALDMLEKTP